MKKTPEEGEYRESASKHPHECRETLLKAYTAPGISCRGTRARGSAYPGTDVPAKPKAPAQIKPAAIRNYTLSPIMLSMLGNRCRNAEPTPYALKKLYMGAIQSLMDRVHDDLAQIRKTLRERNVEVYMDKRKDSSIHGRLDCRGNEDGLLLLKYAARAEISLKLAEHICVRADKFANDSGGRGGLFPFGEGVRTERNG